jgi:hypothetical protein
MVVGMRRARVLGALAAVATLAVGGCSSSDDSSSDGSSSAELCSSADDLRSSLSDMGDVQVAADGTDALRQAFTEVGDDVARLADDAQDQFSDQVSGVESATADVAAAIRSLGSDPSAAALGTVGTAVQALVQDAGVLVDDVSSSC